jgi:ribosomal protein S27E
MTENQIRKMVSSVKCHVCGEHYEKNSIEILGHENDTWFMNVFCPTCKKSIFIAAIIKKDDSQPLTDLMKQEILSLPQGRQINEDDLLDLHNFLSAFDGDFVKLFNQG